MYVVDKLEVKINFIYSRVTDLISCRSPFSDAIRNRLFWPELFEKWNLLGCIVSNRFMVGFNSSIQSVCKSKMTNHNRFHKSNYESCRVVL